MAQAAMPATTPLSITLAELRGLARPRQRRAARVAEATPLLGRLLAACDTMQLEERAPGLVFRLRGETERRAPFHLTCVLHSATDTSRLTPAELAVTELLCEGHTLARIAQMRGVSANTVKSQVRQVFRKLNVDSRVALVRRWCP
jgi:DNA-binding CsgD family transcriptional regulator